MRKTLLLLATASASVAFSAPIITVVTSIGPSGGNPVSDNQYALNALNGLQNGTNNIGSGAATYTRAGATVPVTSLINTSGGVNSWLGQSPGAFAGEFGNALYFGVTVVDTSAKFSLAQLVYLDNFYTYDPINFSNTPVLFNTPSDVYNGTTVFGINYGADNAPGGTGINADSLVTSGAATTLVNALYYRGVNGSFIPSPGETLAQTIARLNTLNGGKNIVLTGGYCIEATPSSGSVPTSPCANAGTNFAGFTTATLAGVPTPEPTTLSMIGLGLVALAFVRCKR